MIKIDINGASLTVTSPYHPDFPKRARSLGGKWAAPKWVFDVRDEPRVRALCREVYGDDGETPVGDLVTLQVSFAPSVSMHGERAGIYLAGRCVAQAYGRDSGAKLGHGVVLVHGTAGKVGWGLTPDAVRSGGSMKNWMTVIEGPCVIEMRDVPRAAADKAIAEAEQKIAAGRPYPTIEII